MSQNVRHSQKMRTTTTTAASNLSIPVGKAARSDNNNDITATTNLSIPMGKGARNYNNGKKHLISNVAIPLGEVPQKGSLGVSGTSVGFDADFLANWGVSKPYSNLYNF